MNTYQFPKHPNARSNSPWRKSKHVFETEQTLPTRSTAVYGLFDNEPAILMPIDKRVSGDTEFNERRMITGFIVQTNTDRPGCYIHTTYRPGNVHLLFDYEGYHPGCNDQCHCVTMGDQEFIKHWNSPGHCQNCP